MYKNIDIIYEFDFAVNKGKVKFSRHHIESWKQIREGTHKTVEPFFKKVKINKKFWDQYLFGINSLLDQYELRVQWIVKEKFFYQFNALHANYSVQGWIFELKYNYKTFSKLWTNPPSFKQVNKWINQVKFHENKPEVSISEISDLNSSIFNFSPQAVGYIFHEGLGHRLESDDYKTLPNWNQKKSLNFEVLDTPGKKGWWGYCPIDDTQSKGKKVPLLSTDFKLIKSSWLCNTTGNLRNSHPYWHPIVRQRCIETKKIFNLNPQMKCKKININEIQDGELFNSKIFLKVTQAEVTLNNISYRIKPFNLEMPLHEIQKLKIYGKREVYHVPGGCSKGLQRNLPITFSCHPAWAKLAKLNFKIF